MGLFPINVQLIALVVICNLKMLKCVLFGRIRSRTKVSSFSPCFISTTTFQSPLCLSLKPNCSIQEAFMVSKEFLDVSGVSDSEASARFLVCDAATIGYRMSDFHRCQNQQMSPAQLEKLKDHCLRRLQRVPVQYIIGNWDFYGLTFRCEPPILIPRPETEELVEMIISSCSTKQKVLQILDVGSGTGAIGIALLSQLKNAKCTAIDIDAKAVSLSMENANSILFKGVTSVPFADDLSLRYNCLHSSFENFSEEARNPSNSYHKRFDIIVSNPPYIPTSEMSTLQDEVSLYESRTALHGGDDGLDIIKAIIMNGCHLFHPGGPQELWMEVSHTHPDVIKKWMDDNAELLWDRFDEVRTSPSTETSELCGALSNICTSAVVAACPPAVPHPCVPSQARADGFDAGSHESSLSPRRRRFEYVEGIRDMSGSPRFVRLRAVWQ